MEIYCGRDERKRAGENVFVIFGPLLWRWEMDHFRVSIHKYPYVCILEGISGVADDKK